MVFKGIKSQFNIFCRFFNGHFNYPLGLFGNQYFLKRYAARLDSEAFSISAAGQGGGRFGHRWLSRARNVGFNGVSFYFYGANLSLAACGLSIVATGHACVLGAIIHRIESIRGISI